MAIHTTQGSANSTYFHTGNAILTAPPISMFARFSADSPAGDGVLICINRSTGFVDAEHYTFETSNGGTQIVARVVGGLGNIAESTAAGTFATGVWTTAGAVFATQTSTTAYLNGVAGTTDTTSALPSNLGDTQLCGRVLFSGAVFRAFKGCIADFAIWSIALSDDDMASLNKGVSPLFIKRQNLVLYCPFVSEFAQLVNLVGPPVVRSTDQNITACVDGPRLILPQGFSLGRGTIAPPPPPSGSNRFYFIERMDNRIWATIEDAWCLDAALAYPMPEPDATLEASSATGDGAIREYNLINGGSGYTAPIGQIEDVEGPGTGATITLGLTSGVITTATANAIGSGYVRPLLTILDATGSGASIAPIISNYTTFSANATVFSTGNLGDIIRMGGGQAEVVSINSGSSVVGNLTSPITLTTPNDPNDTPLPATSWNWSITTPTSSVSGLWHLEGRTVSALADGGVVNDLTVEDGAVSLPVPASQILIGLPFVAQAQLMYLDAGGGPTIQTRRKSGVQAVVRVENSRAPEIGMNQPDAAAQPNQANVPWTTGMTEIKYRTPDMIAGQSAPLMSGDLDITGLFGTYDTKGQVAIQQRDCVPLSISAVVLWVTLGDSTGQ